MLLVALVALTSCCYVSEAAEEPVIEVTDGVLNVHGGVYAVNISPGLTINGEPLGSAEELKGKRPSSVVVFILVRCR